MIVIRRIGRTVRRVMTPSMVVALAALFVALGGTAVAVTGGTFVLGQANTANHQTSLTSSGDGTPALAVTNSGTSAGSFPLKLTSPSGVPPFQTNSTTKVAHLNADQLDGLDSTQFQRPLAGTCGKSAAALTAIAQDGKVSCLDMPYVILSTGYSNAALPITNYAEITVPVASGVQIDFAGSGYAASNGEIGADVWVCAAGVACGPETSISGQPLIFAQSYANTPNIHTPFQSMFEWALAAGTYEIGISAFPGTETGGDDFSLSLIGYPGQ